MSTSPKRLAGLASAALAVAGITILAPTASQANPAGTDLVISEVYGAGGNSGALFNADFVELYNPTANPVDLLGTYVTYRSASGASGGSMALRGSLDAGDHYLVRMSSTGAEGAALTPDRVASPSISMAAAGGQVLLTEGFGPVTAIGNLAGTAGVIDMVGLDPAGTNSFEGSAGPAATATQSANRNAAGADTNVNSVDFSLAAPSPEFCGCVPAAGSFSGTIAEVQGTDTDTSPHLDETVTTTGVVTARYPAGGFNGFFMQTDGTGGAVGATPGAPDGIFVFLGSTNAATAPAIGAKVTVTGPASEFGGLTQISPAATTDVVAAGTAAGVTPWSTAYPTTDAAREAHEGELLAPTNAFTVTNSFNTNTFAEVGLATGTTPLLQPTDVAPPGAGANAVAAANAARAVTMDDGASLSFAAPGAAAGTAVPWLTQPPSPNTQPSPVRVGAAATLKQPLVLDFRNNIWKFQPQTQVTAATDDTVATFANTRKAQPAAVGGDLKLATFNVLNYFNTTGEAYNLGHPGACTSFNDRAGNPIAVNTCSPTGPRGAWMR